MLADKVKAPSDSAVSSPLIEAIRRTESEAAIKQKGLTPEEAAKLRGPKGNAVGPFQIERPAWQDGMQELVDQGVLVNKIPYEEGAENPELSRAVAKGFLLRTERQLRSQVRGYDKLSPEHKQSLLQATYNTGIGRMGQLLRQNQGSFQGFEQLIKDPDSELGAHILGRQKNFETFMAEEQELADQRPATLKLAEAPSPAAPVDEITTKQVDNAVNIERAVNSGLIEAGHVVSEGFQFIGQGIAVGLQAAGEGIQAIGDYTRGAVASPFSKNIDFGDRLTPEDVTGLQSEDQGLTRDEALIGAVVPGYAIGQTIAKNPKGTLNLLTDMVTNPFDLWGMRAVRSAAKMKEALPKVEATNTPGLFSYRDGAVVSVDGEVGEVVRAFNVKKGEQEMIVRFPDGTERSVMNSQARPLAESFEATTNPDTGRPFTREEIDAVLPRGQRVTAGSQLRETVDAFNKRLDELALKAGLRTDEVEKKAAEVLRESGEVTEETLAALRPLAQLNELKMIAANDVMRDAGTKLHALTARWLETGLDADKQAAIEQVKAMSSLANGVLGLRGTAGESLRVANLEPYADQFAATLNSGTRATDEQILLRLAGLNRIEQKADFVKRGASQGWARQFIDRYYLGALLSRPRTAVSVFLGNQSYMAWNMLEQSFASTMRGLPSGDVSLMGKRLFTLPGEQGTSMGTALSRTFDEAGAMWGGYFATWMQMLPKMGKSVESRRAFQTAESLQEFTRALKISPIDDVTKLGPVRFALSNPLTINPITRPLEFAGSLIDLPRTMIVGADVFARWQSFEVMTRMRAARQAFEEAQLTPGNLTAAERSRLQTNLYDRIRFSPRSTPILEGGQVQTKGSRLKTIGDEADAFGAYVSMAQMLDGTISGAVARAGAHPIMKVINPFMAVQWRLGAAAGERTLLGLVHPDIASAVRNGGPAARVAQSKIAMGSTLSAMMGYWWYDGMSTGSGYADKDLRQMHEGLGWRENSFSYRAEDGSYKYVNASLVDPMVTLATFGADIARFSTFYGHDHPLAEEAVNQMVATTTNLMTNTFFFEEMGRLTEVLAADDRGTALTKWSQRKLSNFIPYSALGRQYNDTMREFRVIADGYKEQMCMAIPGCSNAPDAFPAWRNYWGKKVPVDHGWGFDIIGRAADFINPITVTAGNDPMKEVLNDPVLAEFQRQRFIPHSPSRTFSSRGVGAVVSLTPQEWMRRRELFGTVTDENGDTIYEAYERRINSPAYKNAGENADTIPRGGFEKDVVGVRWRMLMDIHQNFSELADLTLLEERPSLQRRLELTGRRQDPESQAITEQDLGLQ